VFYRLRKFENDSFKGKPSRDTNDLKNYKYAAKCWNWDRDVFKRMNIVAKINDLFIDVERIKWIKEFIIITEYDL